jgi:predicted AAA+ superfamily ATPase
MTRYFPREITPLLLKALRTMPVVAVTGMRQAGKSTLLTREKSFAGRHYVSLDDFARLEEARRDPERFLSAAPAMTIDEAQRCPDLFPVIKQLVDQNRRPGRFLLSGSANFLLLKSLTESLAGRAIYLDLPPFNLRETAGRIAHRPFLLAFLKTGTLPSPLPHITSISPDTILRGGFPPLAAHREADAPLWFKGYEQTYLEKDVRSLSQVGDLLAFRRLMQLAALRTAQVLNISDLARDAKLNVATAARYLNLMETSCIAHRLPPFLKNRASRLIKSPKLYLADSGLATHLAFPAATPSDPLFGALLETWAAQNLRSLVEAWEPEGGLYFWNVQGRHEVDFILELSRGLMALEIKSGNRWKESDLAPLRAFLDQTPSCKTGILAYNGTEAVSLGKGMWALPLGLILS